MELENDEDLVPETDETGDYEYDQVVKFMESCEVDRYLQLIEDTIIMKMEQTDDIEGIYSRLKAINAILEI